MSMTDIARLCESLSLSDEDGEVVKIAGNASEEGIEETSHCLVGKILARRRINRLAFKTVIDSLWSAIQAVKIEVVGDNIFVFRFQSKEDKAMVWSKGPWHFDRSLIVLEDPKGPGDITKMSFNQVTFWIQIWNLPLMCMNRTVARLLVEMVGEVVELPQNTEECLGKFMRVRVRVDISKPLRRGLRVNLEDFNLTVTTLIRYERLPEFCFECGKVGHSLRECVLEDPNKRRESPLKYGDWLRASIMERPKNEKQRVESPVTTEQSSDGQREVPGQNFGRVACRLDRDNTEVDQDCSSNKKQTAMREVELQRQSQQEEKETKSLLIIREVAQTQEIVVSPKDNDFVYFKEGAQEGDLEGKKCFTKKEMQGDEMDCQQTNIINASNAECIEKGPDRGSQNDLMQTEMSGSQDVKNGPPRNRTWKRAARSPNKSKVCFPPSPLRQMIGVGVSLRSPNSKKPQKSPKSKIKLNLSPGKVEGAGTKRKLVESKEEKLDGKKSKGSLSVGISAVPGHQGCRTP